MKNWIKFLLTLVVFVALLFGLYQYLETKTVFITYGQLRDIFMWVLSFLLPISALLVGIVIFLENRNPAKTLSWIIILSIIPVLGFILYMLFGQNYRKRRIFHERAKSADEIYDTMGTVFRNWYAPKEWEEMKDKPSVYNLAKRLTHTPISFSTETKILTNGDATFHSIVTELRKASEYIHFQYYIVRDDQISNEIKEILIEKAQKGVKVRFLYDAVGSFQLSRKYIRELEYAGVHVAAYAPVKIPIINDKVNFRNHRKIIVIDGNIGFTGGLNVGDEYLGRVAQYGFWRDTHMYLKGEAVQVLEMTFIHDWYYTTNEIINPHFATKLPNIEEPIDGGVQIVPGGPDTEWEVMKKMFFSMIASAKRNIYIASPYFIPDDDILSALKIAALSGIDVRILTPGIPDKFIVYHASTSYFEEMLEAGVKIYRYNPGFLHSKIIIVDESVASIGTANMDMRSFHLNFEINVFLYGTHSVCTLVQDFKNDLIQSEQIELASFRKRPFRYRVYESFCRLASPLL